MYAESSSSTPGAEAPRNSVTENRQEFRREQNSSDRRRETWRQESWRQQQWGLPPPTRSPDRSTARREDGRPADARQATNRRSEGYSDGEHLQQQRLQYSEQTPSEQSYTQTRSLGAQANSAQSTTVEIKVSTSTGFEEAASSRGNMAHYATARDYAPSHPPAAALDEHHGRGRLEVTDQASSTSSLSVARREAGRPADARPATDRRSEGPRGVRTAEAEESEFGDILSPEEWAQTDPAMQEMIRTFQQARREQSKQELKEDAPQQREVSWHSSIIPQGSVDQTPYISATREELDKTIKATRQFPEETIVHAMAEGRCNREIAKNKLRRAAFLKINAHGPNETRAVRGADPLYRAGTTGTNGRGVWVTFAIVIRPDLGYTPDSNEVFRRTHYTLPQRLNDLRRGLPQAAGLKKPEEVKCTRCGCTSLRAHIKGCPWKGRSTIGAFCKYCWAVIMTRAHYRRHFVICLPNDDTLYEIELNHFAFREEEAIVLVQCRGCAFQAHIPALLQAHEPLCARSQLLAGHRGPIQMCPLEEWSFNGVTLDPPSMLRSEVRQAIARVQAKFPSLRFDTDFSFRDTRGTFRDPLKPSRKHSTAKGPWEPEENRSWVHYVLSYYPDDADPLWDEWKDAGWIDESIRLRLNELSRMRGQRITPLMSLRLDQPANTATTRPSAIATEAPSTLDQANTGENSDTETLVPCEESQVDPNALALLRHVRQKMGVTDTSIPNRETHASPELRALMTAAEAQQFSGTTTPTNEMTASQSQVVSEEPAHLAPIGPIEAAANEPDATTRWPDVEKVCEQARKKFEHLTPASDTSASEVTLPPPQIEAGANTGISQMRGVATPLDPPRRVGCGRARQRHLLLQLAASYSKPAEQRVANVEPPVSSSSETTESETPSNWDDDTQQPEPDALGNARVKLDRLPSDTEYVVVKTRGEVAAEARVRRIDYNREQHKVDAAKRLEESRRRRTEAAKRRQTIMEEGLKDLFKPDNLPQEKPPPPPSRIAEVGARIVFKKNQGKASTTTPRKTPSDTNKRRAEKPVSASTTPVRKNVSQVLTNRENGSRKEHTPKRSRSDAEATKETGRGSAASRKENVGRAESRNTRTPAATPRPIERLTTTKTAADKAEGLAMVTNSMTCEPAGFMTLRGYQPHGIGKAKYADKECVVHCQRIGAGTLPYPVGLACCTTMQLYRFKAGTKQLRPTGTLYFMKDVTKEESLTVTCNNTVVYLKHCTLEEKKALCN